MNNPILMRNLTMAVHEGRGRALHQSRRFRACTAASSAHRRSGISRLLARHLRIGPARVAPQNQFPT